MLGVFWACGLIIIIIIIRNLYSAIMSLGGWVWPPVMGRARSKFSGTLAVYGAETPKIINNLKQEAITY